MIKGCFIKSACPLYRHVARILALGGLSPQAVWTDPPPDRPTPKFFRLRRAIDAVPSLVTVG